MKTPTLACTLPTAEDRFAEPDAAAAWEGYLRALGQRHHQPTAVIAAFRLFLKKFLLNDVEGQQLAAETLVAALQLDRASAWDQFSISPRTARLVDHLHRLGPRAVAEFLLELARDYQLDLAEIERRLEVFADLDPAIVVAAGADRFPPVPLTSIDGGRR